MARITLVVFSLSLMLSMQLVIGGKKPIDDINKYDRQQNEKVMRKEVKRDQEAGLQDAVNKGIVQDKTLTFDASFSPQQEEEFLMKLFFKALMKVADEGRMDPKVLKNKLFPGMGDQMKPEIKPEVIRALRDAMRQTDVVKDGKADTRNREPY